MPTLLNINFKKLLRTLAFIIMCNKDLYVNLNNYNVI